MSSLVSVPYLSNLIRSTICILSFSFYAIFCLASANWDILPSSLFPPVLCSNYFLNPCISRDWDLRVAPCADAEKLLIFLDMSSCWEGPEKDTWGIWTLMDWLSELGPCPFSSEYCCTWVRDEKRYFTHLF